MNLAFRQSLLFVALALPALTQTRNIVVLPAGPPSDLVNRNATLLNADTFNSSGTVAVGLDAYAAFTLPNGTKTYVVARGASNTVTVLTNATSGSTVTRTIDLPTGTTDAYLTPDGRRLLTVSLNESAMTVIETVNDTVVVRVPLSAPANTVVTNFESSRAFTSSPNGAVVTAIDLTTNAAIGTVSVPSEITLVSGLAVGPNGLIYVSAVNRLFEIDPRTVQLTAAAAIVLTGSPGRPQFTPDGTRALMTNFTPISGGSALILADLVNRSTQFTSLSGLTLDRIRMVSNSLAYGYAPGSQTLYNINLTPLQITPVNTAGLPPLTNFRGLSSSNEAPQNRFLYVGNGTTVYRVDIATNTVTGTLALTNNAGAPLFQAQPSSAALANLFAVNQQQFVAISGTTLPMVVRALDGAGLPIVGAAVTYSTTANGVTIANPTVLTNSEGYAQTTATVPNFQTSLTVVATVGTGNTQVFTLNVGFGGGSGGGGGTGRITILSGNGQIIFANSPTPQPMRVRVTDGNGNPVPTATVTWTITGGNGQLGNTDTLTDSDGIATNQSYAGPLLFGNFASFVRNSLTATTSLGSVTFSHITIPRFLDGNSNPTPAAPPAIAQIFPLNNAEIRGANGSTIKGAFQFRISSQLGLNNLQGISGIGVEAQTLPQEGSLDTVSSQTARCADNPLSGDNGIVTCDLVVGGRVGTSVLNIIVGGFQSFKFPYTVTQGPPKNITGLSGNNQTGVSGRTLNRSLVARIDDGFGTNLNGIRVTWTIQSGSATLVETISTSGRGLVQDPNDPLGAIGSDGLVSTNIRLGNSPGDIRVRASVTPTIFADFTVTNSLAISNLNKVDGDNQSAVINTAFANPLVVEVRDTNGVVAPGVPVTFTSNGGVTISNTTVTTDNNGRARVTATAGPAVGSYTVTAASGTFTATFTLSATPLGPTISSIVNGASFQPGLSPCAIAQINGTNFATGINGTISGQSIVGPLATTLNGISVQIGGVNVPLFNVSNISGRESLSFQVPCEQSPGPVTLTLRSGTNSVNRSVTIDPYAPGIFTSPDASGRQTVVAVKANGTYVSSTNPAELNEDIRVYVTGLGQGSPFINTNTPGTGTQRVNAPVVVGLNNEGIQARVEDTLYAPTLIGVYIVTFRMPATGPTGLNRPFVIAVQGPDGNLTYSQSAVIDVR
ncbi:MAG: Ig-like domain-containing protein [Bryobacteraceae bacterium]|nr:Ig-like domain-containing protein [Bryobacteraceae bacterium]